ncbi:DnaJ family domain-containing protein [Bilophila wadsworthia]|uniref:DnaJ family domain-containing protein n=2 Tax=Bilophila TaxID=35832 RepID=UPI003990A594
MEERVQFRPDAETDPQSIPFGEANPLRTGPARDNLSEKTMFQGVTMDAISIIAEQRIREACERGAFDSLPGAGKPLELEDDSHIPEDLRMAYKLLKNAGYVPEEVLDRKEAQSIVDALEKCGDEQEKVRQMKKLEVVIARIKARHPNAPVLGDGSPYYERVVCRITVNKKD